MNNWTPAVEAVLFASGDSIPVSRLSLILGVEVEIILQILRELQTSYEKEGRGFRILFLEDKVQMCSAPEFAGIINRLMEQRKPPALSQPAMEALALVAYFQPVTRAYIEQVRGVDSSYTVSMLAERGLIEECGRLEVPGRPAVFHTTDVFLRTMGISSLTQLPPLPENEQGDGTEKLQEAIKKLSIQGVSPEEQITMEEISDIGGEEG